MNILIVDDMRHRHDGFKSQIFGEDVNMVHAMSGEEAISLMGNTDFDYVFLDHDMGEHKMDGRDVCVSINKLNLVKDSAIIIHSANSVAAITMKSILRNHSVIVAPFPLFKFFKRDNGIVIE